MWILKCYLNEKLDHKGGKKSEYDNDDDDEEPGMHRTVQCNGQ